MPSVSHLFRCTLKIPHDPAAVRAAANRMARAGLLTKAGKGWGNLQYRVGPRGRALIEQFIAKIARWHMSLEGQRTWDGRWLVLTFSVPEGERSKRDAFRNENELAGLGFGLLSSSVWISPFSDYEPGVIALVEELGLTGLVTLMRCQRTWMPGLESPGDLARQVWALDGLASRYRGFNRRMEALLASLERVSQEGENGAETTSSSM